MMQIRQAFMIFGAMFALGACSSTPIPEESGVAAEPAPFVAEDYRLGPGDRLRLTVFGETDLSGDFAVDGAGQISLPLVGEIVAAGRTVREVQAGVDAALRGDYLKDPKVSAEVVTYRPFYILGEVKRPGTYPYQNGLTVVNAVATAEGFTFRANDRVVFIRRDGADEEVRYQLTSSLTVRPGDTLRITERLF